MHWYCTRKALRPQEFPRTVTQTAILSLPGAQLPCKSRCFRNFARHLLRTCPVGLISSSPKRCDKSLLPSRIEKGPNAATPAPERTTMPKQEPRAERAANRDQGADLPDRHDVVVRQFVEH